MSELQRRPLIAVVDDEPSQRQILRKALEEAQYQVVEASDGAEAIGLAQTHPLDAMLLDVRMPNVSGLQALEAIKKQRPAIIIILLTAYIDLRDAVAAIKQGAHDYLEKPVDLDELLVAVDEALGVGRDHSAPAAHSVLLPEGVVAESPAMQAVFREALQVAPTEASVVITGESGTGKEVIAQFIHDKSHVRGAFVAVNCAALPENLIESELFGHERGAFTGAIQSKPGRFEEAEGGTLFLDEIGEMPLLLQAKLLRVLEERTLRRVGGSKEIKVNLRVLAATNRSLAEEVSAGRFREDLLYRLNVFAIHIPPLRERRDDLLPLADGFLALQGMREKRLSPATQHLLASYAWPGNVRELRNAIIRAAIISRGPLILPDDLPEAVRNASPAPNSSELSFNGDMGEIQKRAILNAMEQTGGNKTKAAELLGISRRNLIYKLRSYGL